MVSKPVISLMKIWGGYLSERLVSARNVTAIACLSGRESWVPPISYFRCFPEKAKIVGYLAIPTGPRGHRDYVGQWVVLNNQQNMCLGVRQLTLTDFVTGVSGALSPRYALP